MIIFEQFCTVHSGVEGTVLCSASSPLAPDHLFPIIMTFPGSPGSGSISLVVEVSSAIHTIESFESLERVNASRQQHQVTLSSTVFLQISALNTMPGNEIHVSMTVIGGTNSSSRSLISLYTD